MFYKYKEIAHAVIVYPINCSHCMVRDECIFSSVIIYGFWLNYNHLKTYVVHILCILFGCALVETITLLQLGLSVIPLFNLSYVVFLTDSDSTAWVTFIFIFIS